MSREEAELREWMKKFKITNPEDFRIKLREHSEIARYEFNRIMRVLNTYSSEFAVELRRILERKRLDCFEEGCRQCL